MGGGWHQFSRGSDPTCDDERPSANLRRAELFCGQEANAGFLITHIGQSGDDFTNDTAAIDPERILGRYRYSHPVFSVEGQDLTTHREIKLTEALLGTTVSVPTLDGKQYNLKVPAGTKSGTRLRLSGQGLPAMKGGKKGDLFVRVLVEIPRHLDTEQKRLVEKLAETGL